MDEITVVVLGDPAEPAFGKFAGPGTGLGAGVEVRIGKTADSLGDALHRARALFNWNAGKDEIRQVLERAPRLEWIHARFAGLDRLLFPELIESPVVLTNGTGVFSQSLGEFVIMGALYFAKDAPRLLRAKAERRWDVFNSYEVSKQTIGIVGHGDIGRAVSRRAKAFGMRVLALRRDPSPRPGDEDVDRVYASADLHAMLPECDYVVSTAPMTPETEGMLGRPEFALMKPGAIIMNVGRGPVIDEPAMIEALETKQIRGAWLDVFDVEPLPADSPLWGMENVYISPHCADHTQDWLEDSAQFFIDQFRLWRAGTALKNVVDKRAGY